MTETFSRAEAARRAGLDAAYFERLEQHGLPKPDLTGHYTKGQARRGQLIHVLERAGIPLEGLAEALNAGQVSLDFVERDEYERFAALADETFAQVSARTAIPFELLAVMREAIGLAAPSPDDRIREDELDVIPFIAGQVRLGFRTRSIERLLRVTGESLRRITEQEADWWRTEVIEPSFTAAAQGSVWSSPLSSQASDVLANLGDVQLLAIYHARQAQAWNSNIVAGLERELSRMGLYSRLEHPPAICFLDITGYTRLTQERGDAAAAGLAEQLNRLVQRSALAHNGKPIKWLGDGVMLYFTEPGRGVEGALEMIEGVASAGLPPAHVGLHAGPVLFQEGDYFGTTVNVAARIAEYARPGEVLVSQAVVDAAADSGVTFADVGPVELKGVAGALQLHSAKRGA